MNHILAQSSIPNLIDDAGRVTASPEEVAIALKNAEDLCKSMIGGALHVRGKTFYIRMLEVYYGGAGDDGHDWYRNHHVYKTSKYRARSRLQTEKGMKAYLCYPDIEDTYNRMDIVMGDEGVPLSFLIRSVWDENFQRIGEAKGSPNKVMRAMGIRESDHGKEILMGSPNKDKITFSFPEKEFIAKHNLVISSRKRVNLKPGFEEKHNVEWCLYGDLKKVT